MIRITSARSARRGARLLALLDNLPVLPVLPVLLVLASLAGTRVTQAADEAPDPKRTLYVRYCSACHGQVGEGDGPAAQYMTPRPTNLTQIMKKHDNTFPFTATMKVIDGSNNVRAHGTPELPVWGEDWREESTTSPTERAQILGKVMMITQFVMSIQDRPPIQLNFTPPKKK